MAADPAANPSAPRTCGACTMCCKVLAVEELDKDGGVWCPHCLPGEGCSIYEERPASCRGFACLWLQGSLADTDRPDRLGAVFWAAPDNQRHYPDGRSVPYIILSEAHEGAALSRRRTRQIVTDLLQRGTPVALACSPKTDPGAMRVPMAPGRGRQETLNREANEAFPGAGHRQAA